jgi:phosphoserine phosphatase RsbU/P
MNHGAPEAPVLVEARTVGDKFELSVANGGPAIPEAVRARLFQPFVRGATTGRAQGLGLGLFIVSEIARAHGGAVDVSSTDAETRFAFSMPRLAEGRRDTAPPTPTG